MKRLQENSSSTRENTSYALGLGIRLCCLPVALLREKSVTGWCTNLLEACTTVRFPRGWQNLLYLCLLQLALPLSQALPFLLSTSVPSLHFSQPPPWLLCSWHTSLHLYIWLIPSSPPGISLDATFLVRLSPNTLFNTNISNKCLYSPTSWPICFPQSVFQHLT